MTVDTFEVAYTLNSGIPVTQMVTNPLLAGASTTVSFPAITVPAGTNNIGFSVMTVSGSSFVDNVSINNTASSGDFSTLSPTAFATTHTEGFEGYALATPAPAHAILENPQSNWAGVIDPTYTNGQPVGGYGNSANSYRFRFASFGSGQSAKLIWEKLDFSTLPNSKVSFDYAHALQNSWDQDVVQILVSTDCGVTWNIEDDIIGSALSTAAPLNGTNYYPQAGDWVTHTVDLSNYDGNTDVMIAINAICGGGNNLYIDNLVMEGNADSWNCDALIGCFNPGNGAGQYTTLASCQSACNSTAVDEEKVSSISIYPTPANDFINIEISSVNNEDVSISVCDLIGKQIKEIKNQKLISGLNTIEINTLDLPNGTYFIKLKLNKETISKKLIITH